MSEEKHPYHTKAQTIFRTAKNPDNPYVMIDRRVIENPNLSWKAKGLLAYLLSRAVGQTLANRKVKQMEHPQWFFMWVTGKPYVTTICGWTKKDVIREVEKNGGTWKETYARGGRVVRVRLQVCQPALAHRRKARVGSGKSKLVGALRG